MNDAEISILARNYAQANPTDRQEIRDYVRQMPQDKQVTFTLWANLHSILKGDDSE